MKTMRRITTYLLGLLVLVSVSCTDENEFLDRNEYGSVVEREGSLYVSSFHIDKSLVTFSRDITKVKAHFSSLSDGSHISDIETHIEHHEDKHVLRMRFAEKIENGDYRLRFTRDKETKTRAAVPNIDEDLPEFVFDVTIEDMMIKSVELESMSRSDLYHKSFMGRGSGTEADPYRIGSKEEFDLFKAALSQDTVLCGAGLFFKQTADFVAPRISDVTDGSYSSCYNFAGVYDGGGFKISDVIYMGGSNPKSNLGLFAVLLDGAKVSNLTIENFDFDTVGDNCGGLAGMCKGNVTIENVFVSGDIAGESRYIGGLIGRVSDSNLTVNNCVLSVSLTGSSYIGGTFGRVYNSTIKVDGITNMDKSVPSQSLKTKLKGTGDIVGGFAGSIESSKFEINHVKWQNTVDKETCSVEHISAEKGFVGGLIGSLCDNKEHSSLSNIQILTPVHSRGNNVGGIVGYYHSNIVSNNDVSITNVTFASYIKGVDYVGGFFGYVNNSIGLNFNGGNKISQVSDGYLEVVGNNNVGGIIGYAHGNLSFSAPFTINVNINAKNNVGGCVGSYGSGTLSCKNFVLSPAMTVKGNSDIGGIVGELYEEGTVVGTAPSLSEKISKNNSIPAASQFEEYSTFAGTVKAPDGCSGGIVGSVKSADCELKDLVFTGTVEDGVQAGGIVGDHQTDELSIENCINISNKMIGKTSTSVGGIIGELRSGSLSIEYCLNYTTMDCVGEAVAGIVAKKNQDCDLHIDNAINVGDIKGPGIVAGIVALDASEEDDYSDLFITESANYGNITSTNGKYVGGIVAQARKIGVHILNSANHGNIHGDKATKVGGLAAYIGANSYASVGANIMVENSCNKGTISSGEWNAYIGGLIGQQGDGNLAYSAWGTYDCYNTGAITSKHDKDSGGIVGYAEDLAYIQRCINTGMVSKGNGGIGTHRGGIFSSVVNYHSLYFLEGTGADWSCHPFDKDDKKTETTFVDFDFDKVWAIDYSDTMNDGFPYLRDCKYQNMKVER